MPTKHTMDDMVPKKRSHSTKPKIHHRKEVTERHERHEIDEVEGEEDRRIIEEASTALGLSPRPKREPINSASNSSSFKTKGKFGRRFIFGLIFISGLMYGATFFTRVRATLTPKIKKENIVASLRLNKLALNEVVATSTLSFDIFFVPKETAEETLETTGMEKVSKKASGDIIIFNNYSNSPVILVANTRFQAPNGNIYRLKDQVSIPGMKAKTGTTTLPGSLTVKVYADKAGASYNMKLTDFTIPGFKGSPQYTKVDARSKTEMSGGFEGDSAVISEVALTAVRERLKASVLERLNKNQSVQVPAGRFIIPGVSSVLWDEKQTIKDGDPGKVVFSVSGESTGILVKKEALDTILSGEEGYTLANADKISFTLEKGDTGDIKNLKTGLLRVSGPGIFVAIVPKSTVLTSMLGKKKSELQDLFNSFPSVDNAKIVFFPLWAMTVPSDQNRVTTQISQGAID